jgi:hypothetical protein
VELRCPLTRAIAKYPGLAPAYRGDLAAAMLAGDDATADKLRALLPEHHLGGGTTF